MNDAGRCIHDMVEGTCGICNEQKQAAKTCKWCGRELRDPVSRGLEVGPVCFSKDTRAQDRVFEQIRASDRWFTYGPLPHNTAVLWTNAFNRVDGIEAHIRTDDDRQALIWARAKQHTY